MNDYINRDATIEKIRYEGIYGDGYSDEELENDVVDMIESIPAAEVKPVVRGKWISIQNGSGICSNCNRLDHIDPLANYCRYCGADMREGTP